MLSIMFLNRLRVQLGKYLKFGSDYIRSCSRLDAANPELVHSIIWFFIEHK